MERSTSTLYRYKKTAAVLVLTSMIVRPGTIAFEEPASAEASQIFTIIDENPQPAAVPEPNESRAAVQVETFKSYRDSDRRTNDYTSTSLQLVDEIIEKQLNPGITRLGFEMFCAPPGASERPPENTYESDYVPNEGDFCEITYVVKDASDDLRISAQMNIGPDGLPDRNTFSNVKAVGLADCGVEVTAPGSDGQWRAEFGIETIANSIDIGTLRELKYFDRDTFSCLVASAVALDVHE